MKILSLNIKSFGSGKDSKLGDFKKLCRAHKPNIVALLKTKLHSVKDSWIFSLWGSRDCKFIQKEMTGKSGGQLIIWDVNYLDVFDTFICDFFISVRGIWKISGQIVNMINVYGPHNDIDKHKMWDALSKEIQKGNGEGFVLCGDFNEVRDETERLNSDYHAHRAKAFNDFIASNNLIDLPMGGRKFTRVSDDGVKYSKLDHFLITKDFNLMWKNFSVVALERKISDHCPIFLKG
ncbi:uncharacterized protein [Rutidosis leptorrhynchoides]|uniref:uncharacterized protein n=1 Tax=Rutidosis leptorrhynchoides TaxID=125765 RepID=UPI003A9A3368